MNVSMRLIRMVLIGAIISLPLTQDRAWASLAPANLSSASGIQSSNKREADLEVIRHTLESKMVRQRLKDLGYNDADIQGRLSKLSDQDVHQMASQIRTINPAGDIGLFAILIVVVLVLLIIYLFKRI